MSNECNHAVGTATVEYQLDILHADNDGSEPHQDSFSPFAFCPYCGADVSAEADELAQRIADHWEKFWKRYGEEEVQRVRQA